MICITPCGKKKGPRYAKARDLYQGPYFKACLAYARSLLPEDRIFILSAKHGLIRTDEWLEPYELRFGNPGAITADKIAEQAQALGIAQETALILGGADYTVMTTKAFASRVSLMATIRPQLKDPGMFGQMEWLREHRGTPPPGMQA